MIEESAESVMDRRGAPLPMLLVPVLLGLLVYLATLSGSFLSDDYLISRFVGPDGNILWGQAFQDFEGPWGGFEGGLYRPLISLSLCVDTMLGGGGPASFHATNLVFHSISIFCVAWLCGRYASEHKGALALLGGSFFALSPVGVEAVAWILGRVSSQEVAFRLIALCAFTAWLEERRRGRYALTAVFAMAALLSKESAVVLPLAFVGLDLLHGGRGRDLIKRQLLFVPIWIFYAALRLNALSTGGARSAGDLLIAFPASLLPKAQSLFLPGFDSPILLWAVLAFLILFLVRLGPARWPWILTALVLWSLQFLPSTQVLVNPDLSGSRILYGPLALTLVLITAGLGLPAKGLALGLNALLAGLLFISLPFLGKAAGQRVASYQKAWTLVDGYRSELQARAPDSSLERPMTLLSAPADRWGIPLLRADTLFGLFEHPFSRRQTPMLSLIPVFRMLPEQREMLFDTLPIRSLWERGVPLLTWDGTSVSTQKKPQKAQSLELDRVSDRSFRFAAGPVNPYAFEGIELEIEGIEIEGEAQSLSILLPAEAVHAAWQTLKLGKPIGKAEDGKGQVHRIDLSHDHNPLIASLLGDIAGFELAGKGKILSLEVLGHFATLADGLLPDQEVTLNAEGRLSLQAPSLPEGAMGMRFYLIGPYGGLSMAVDPGQSILLAADKTRVLRSFFLLGSQRHFYLFFEAQPKPGHWPSRSAGTMIRIRPD